MHGRWDILNLKKKTQISFTVLRCVQEQLKAYLLAHVVRVVSVVFRYLNIDAVR